MRPASAADGLSGIAVGGGRTKPFVVARSWSAPAGVYPEGWYLIDPSTREVFYERTEPEVSVFGLQSLTEVVTEVTEPIPLAPGSYQVVFALGGVMGGQLDVDVSEAPAG